MASTTLPGAAPHPRLRALRRLLGSQEMVLFLCIVVLLLVVGTINPRFVAERNLTSIFLGNAYIAVAAIGMSMVIISGNIDISVGSLIGVLATLSGSLAVAGYPIVVSWLAPLVVGALVTALMGFLVAYLRIPSIVVTLGMLSILKGGLISVTGGAWITNLPAGYALAQARPLGIPMPIWFMVVLTTLAALWMRHTATGRAIYAVGGHAEAARVSGHLAPPHDHDGVRDPRRVRRHRERPVRDPAQRDPVDRAAQPRAHHHHRDRGRRGQHPGRHRHRGRRDARRDPARRDRLVPDLRQHLALLAARGAGRADPDHGARRSDAPPPPGARRLMATLARRPPEALRRAAGALLSHEGVLALILVASLALLATQTDRFLTTENLLNQGRLAAEVGLVAMPMTFIIVTGGIDLSVGSVLGLCAILLGVFWQNLGLPLPLAIALTLVVGGLAGAFNGWFITRVGVPPLIMTLATLALFRGLAEGISQARSVRGYPDWFFQLGQGEVLGVPTQLWLLLAVILLSAVVLATTTFGRALYAIGHNQLAARFSGIPVDRMKLLIYTFSGLMAGLAGVIFVSRVSTTRSDMGTGLELDVIAAVVLGGTSIFGGTGTILGTVLGVILIQLLKNGLALTGVKGDATIVVIGTVLILSILITSWLRRRQEGEA